MSETASLGGSAEPVIVVPCAPEWPARRVTAGRATVGPHIAADPTDPAYLAAVVIQASAFDCHHRPQPQRAADLPGSAPALPGEEFLRP